MELCAPHGGSCRDGPTPIDPSLRLAYRKASPAGQVEDLHAPVEDHGISQVLRRKGHPEQLEDLLPDQRNAPRCWEVRGKDHSELSVPHGRGRGELAQDGVP